MVGSEWIQADGKITSQTPQNFIELMSQSDSKCYFVALNSGGGDLVAGIKLGRLFRKYGCVTWIAESIPFESPDERHFDTISGECYSSCAYAFLGGVERFVSEGDKYGIHQHYLRRAWSEPLEKTVTAIDLTVSQFLTGVLMDYVIEMGVDPRLVSLATKVAPNKDMLLLKRDEQIKLRVVTDTPLPLEKWSLVPFNDGALAGYLLQPAHLFAEETQAVLTCNRENKRLILSLTTRVGAEWLSQVTAELEDRQKRPHGAALTLDLRTTGGSFVSDYLYSVTANSVRLSLWFPESLGERLSTAETMRWEVEASRANQGMLRGEISLRGLAQILPYIYRECDVTPAKR